MNDDKTDVNRKFLRFTNEFTKSMDWQLEDDIHGRQEQAWYINTYESLGGPITMQQIKLYENSMLSKTEKSSLKIELGVRWRFWIFV